MYFCILNIINLTVCSDYKVEIVLIKITVQTIVIEKFLELSKLQQIYSLLIYFEIDNGLQVIAILIKHDPSSYLLIPYQNLIGLCYLLW